MRVIYSRVWTRAHLPTAAHGRGLYFPHGVSHLSTWRRRRLPLVQGYLLLWIGLRGSLPGNLVHLATCLWYLPSAVLLGLDGARPSCSAMARRHMRGAHVACSRFCCLRALLFPTAISPEFTAETFSSIAVHVSRSYSKPLIQLPSTKSISP